MEAQRLAFAALAGGALPGTVRLWHFSFEH
jgi:hypothetical protein